MNNREAQWMGELLQRLEEANEIAGLHKETQELANMLDRVTGEYWYIFDNMSRNLS